MVLNPERARFSCLAAFPMAARKFMKKLILIVVGAYMVLMVASLVHAQASAAKLAAERCAPCHGTARICEKLGGRAPEVWRQTVKRMVSNGAKLNDSEADSVAEYLAVAKPGAKALCGK